MQEQFVDWFRQVSPYIHAHRNNTFVISIGGESLYDSNFLSLIHDVALLNSLGIRIVLVHGIRPQVEKEMAEMGLTPHYVQGMRVTDANVLECAKRACGEVYISIETGLSMGLANAPSTQARIRVSSGNYVVARPIGVRDGIDYQYTGEVRRIDAQAIKRQLDEHCIVLISPMGYSPTGEVFNLLSAELAAEVAIALRATKWIYFTEQLGILDEEGELIHHLSLADAQQLLLKQEVPDHRLRWAIKACQQGVQRVHLISRQINGGLLLELFTRDGIGTLISSDAFEHIRKGTIDDMGGLIALIQPLEEAGVLVRRSREKLEMEINQFTVQERDGMIIACAALYPFFDENMAEIACFAVHPNYRGEQRGDSLLAFLEREARKLNIEHIFVLTTRTAHWFQERGFELATLDILPMAKRALYNYQRRSKVFIKRLRNV